MKPWRKKQIQKANKVTEIREYDYSLLKLYEGSFMTSSRGCAREADIVVDLSRQA